MIMHVLATRYVDAILVQGWPPIALQTKAPARATASKIPPLGLRLNVRDDMYAPESSAAVSRLTIVITAGDATPRSVSTAVDDPRFRRS